MNKKKIGISLLLIFVLFFNNSLNANAATISGCIVMSPLKFKKNVSWYKILREDNKDVVDKINKYCEKIYGRADSLSLRAYANGVKFAPKHHDEHYFTYEECGEGMFMFEMNKCFFCAETPEEKKINKKAREALKLLMVATIPNGATVYNILEEDSFEGHEYAELYYKDTKKAEEFAQKKCFYRSPNTWYSIGNTETKFEYTNYFTLGKNVQFYFREKGK